MRKTSIFVFLFAACLVNISNAQNIVMPHADTLNIQQKKPFGICLSLGGPALATSVSAVYYIRHNLKGEVGIGTGFFAGATIHFSNDNFNDNWTAYTGIYISRFELDAWYGPDIRENNIYCPIGMQYLNPSGFNFATEVAYRVSPVMHRDMWGAIKFGLQF